MFGNLATCAPKFASVTGIKPGNLFPSALFQGKKLWQAVALCIAGIQGTVPGVLPSRSAGTPNPDLSVWPLPVALEC